MRFGLSLIGDDHDDWQRHVVAADAAGFWGLGVGDSQSLYPDPYARLAHAATLTEHIRLATWVTNPVTRHPAVTARAISTINRLSGGRAVLGIGTGDSALTTLGLRPPPLTRLTRYVSAVHALLHEGHTLWDGAPCRMSIEDTPAVPIYVAASGPRGLRAAGRLADGVIVGTGVGDEITTDTLRRIDAGWNSAPPGTARPDVWWLLLANLSEDDEQALAEVKNSLAGYANLAFRTGFAGKHLPTELEGAVSEIHHGYRPMEHIAFDGTHHAHLVDNLGLTGYLRRRFSVCGTPDGVVAQLADLHDQGCENIWLNVRVRDKERFLRLWQEAVAPQLAARGLWAPPDRAGARG